MHCSPAPGKSVAGFCFHAIRNVFSGNVRNFNELVFPVAIRQLGFIGGRAGSFLGEYQAGGRILVLGLGLEEET